MGCHVEAAHSMGQHSRGQLARLASALHTAATAAACRLTKPPHTPARQHQAGKQSHGKLRQPWQLTASLVTCTQQL